MKSLGFLSVVILCLALVAPAHAQYYNQGYNQGYYQQGGGYYQQGYGYTPSSGGGFRGFTSRIGNWLDRTLGGGDGEGLGRTLGGAAGIAAGSFGGAALASAVIKSAGVAAMGPIAPILVGTAITAGGAFLGAKLLSHGGSWMDSALGPDMTWTLVGGIAGSVAGFALLPALGPFAGPAGRVIGAALGGVAGGVLGKIFAPHLQRFATTKTIYGATGALLGGVGFGIPGALMGAVGGYALGSIFNKNFFSEPGSSLTGDLRRNAVDLQTPYYGLRGATADIGNWVRGGTNSIGNRLRSNNDSYYDYTRGYPAGGYAYSPQNTNMATYTGSAMPSAPAATADTAQMDAAEVSRRMNDAMQRYHAAEQSGNAQAAGVAFQEYNAYRAQLSKMRGGN
jgi:hypothetical protein